MSNPVALITGASRNIGAEIARTFASSGYDVVLMARAQGDLDRVAERIRAEGTNALALACDFSRPADVRLAVERAQETYGDIEVLVHNAVLRVQKPFLDIDDAEWYGCLDVILNSGYQLTRAVLPKMLERGFGRIIYMSGRAAEAGRADRAAVTAAKNGLVGLAKSIAAEFTRCGITANVVSPGAIDTQRGEWTAVGAPHVVIDDAYVDGLVAGRLGTMSEIARACLFLASTSSGYISGTTLRVNGGELMA